MGYTDKPGTVQSGHSTSVASPHTMRIGDLAFPAAVHIARVSLRNLCQSSVQLHAHSLAKSQLRSQQHRPPLSTAQIEKRIVLDPVTRPGLPPSRDRSPEPRRRHTRITSDKKIMTVPHPQLRPGNQAASIGSMLHIKRMHHQTPRSACQASAPGSSTPIASFPPHPDGQATTLPSSQHSSSAAAHLENQLPRNREIPISPPDIHS